MEFFDIVTIAIAIYGAIVSSILGIKEFKKDRRKISILLIREEWMQRYSLTVTNTGYRPITLVDLHINISGLNVPKNSIQKNVEPIKPEKNEDWIFPITLTDGEHITTYLSDILSDEIYQSKNRKTKINIEVYDAEGNKYTKYEELFHDEKYGFYRLRN